jgi:hypothetical protein
LKRSAFLRKPSDTSRLTVKQKKCKVCGELYFPRSSWQRACSHDCVIQLGKADVEKAAREAAKESRKADRAKLTAMKPRKWWLAKAKKALHAYIRERDEGQQCISCDTILVNTGKAGGDYDAGHFRSVGSAKHLEMVEANIFGQCKHCNDFLKGNQLEYERRLRIRKGDEYVDALKADQAERKLTIEDYQQIEATYKQKLKQLKEKT